MNSIRYITKSNVYVKFNLLSGEKFIMSNLTEG